MTVRTLDRSFRSLTRYFFNEFLSSQKGLADSTIMSYKEAFKIFIPWLLKATGKKSPTIDDITLILILDFLDYLEKERGNSIHSRNARLAAIKTFFKMCYLLHQDTKKLVDAVLYIPMKKAERPLIDFFEHTDAEKILKTINRHRNLGFRNYAIVNLLYDSGMRASEVANLKINGFDKDNDTLEFLGKGNKWRKIDIWPRTTQLLDQYLNEYRRKGRPIYSDFLFINQRGAALTRKGIYNICDQHIKRVPDIKKPFISAKRSAVHSWRHTAAVNMIRQGRSLLEVKTRLGHASFDSTAKYLSLNLTTKRQCMKAFEQFTNRFIDDSDIAESMDWNNRDDVIAYIRSL
jgi:integrase/recombinase XerD